MKKKEYTIQQIHNKIQEAERWLLQSVMVGEFDKHLNTTYKRDCLHGCKQCLSAAWNMMDKGVKKW